MKDTQRMWERECHGNMRGKEKENEGDRSDGA